MESFLFNVAYWHWILFGLVLVLIELFAPMFVSLWLGIAAILIGVALALFSFSVSLQLILWVMLSTIFLLLWHRYISPKMTDRTTAGLSREAMIGQVGMITFYSHEEGRGQLKFPAPIVGNDEWEFIFKSDSQPESSNNGDKIVVCDISGNTLIVKPQR